MYGVRNKGEPGSAPGEGLQCIEFFKKFFRRGPANVSGSRKRSKDISR
jgi:hypothetical protein